jgi:hypothetical protein
MSVRESEGRERHAIISKYPSSTMIYDIAVQ